MYNSSSAIHTVRIFFFGQFLSTGYTRPRRIQDNWELLLMCQWDIGTDSIDKLSGQLSIAGQYCQLSRHFW